MTRATTIYLVRHGQSTDNLQVTITGQNDAALTELGREQAHAMRRKLQGVVFDEVYSSDLRRAMETAEIITGEPVPERHRSVGLRERNFGSWQGQPQRLLHAENDQKRAMPHNEAWRHKSVADAESDAELAARFTAALAAVARQNAGKTILVVAHGAAIRTLLMQLTGLGYAELPPDSFPNGGSLELSYTPDRGFELVHIEGLQI